MKKQTIDQRIQAVLKERGIEKNADFARLWGVIPQLAHKYWSGAIQNPPAKELFSLADKLGVEARWLAFEEGPKEASKLKALDNDTKEIVAAYQSADSEDKATILQVSRSVAKLTLAKKGNLSR